MPTEQQFLVSLLVKVGIAAAMASILARWNPVKRMLLREQRTAPPAAALNHNKL